MNVGNVIERFTWTAIQAAAGSWVATSITLNLSDSAQVRAALWAAGTAALLSIAKNLTAEGVVVQSAKRAQERDEVPLLGTGAADLSGSSARVRRSSPPGAAPVVRAARRPRKPPDG